MMLSSPWKQGAGIRPASVCCPGPSAVCAVSPAGGVGLGGLVFIIHMSSTPVFSVPSTLRSPSSPIHEEDEEKLSQDSDAPPPLSGAGLALSSSPEVRPFCHPVPTACVGLQTGDKVRPGPPHHLLPWPPSLGSSSVGGFLFRGAVRAVPEWGPQLAPRPPPPCTACSGPQSCRHTLLVS